MIVGKDTLVYGQHLMGTGLSHHRRPAMTAERATRRARARRATTVGLLIVLALVASGCSFLGGTSKTISRLQGAGYHNVGVNIQTGSGTPSDGLVDISYSTGPTGNTARDAYNAAHIVWETLGYRFGALVITRVSGGCAGPFCVSHETELGGETYSQMRDQFGPRPAGLDTTSASAAVRFPGWALPAVLVVLVTAVTAAVTLVVVAIVRKRRRLLAQQAWSLPQPLAGEPPAWPAHSAQPPIWGSPQRQTPLRGAGPPPRGRTGKERSE
jgi:hypothetical protein